VRHLLGRKPREGRHQVGRIQASRTRKVGDGFFFAIEPDPPINRIDVGIFVFSPQLVVGVENKVWAVEEVAIQLVEAGASILGRNLFRSHPVTVHPLAVAIVGSSALVPWLPETVMV
jgi:hypothetical protein